jgi:hypothetical protein
MIRHREIKGVVRNCTVSKTPTGKFFVSILSEVEYVPVNYLAAELTRHLKYSVGSRL